MSLLIYLGEILFVEQIIALYDMLYIDGNLIAFVHRDITLWNILIRRYPGSTASPKGIILDFSCAAKLDDFHGHLIADIRTNITSASPWYPLHSPQKLVTFK